MPRLTAEQKAVVEAARSGEDLKIVAFAGTGKTFTLREITRALQRDEPRRIVYLTFSRALAGEARERFADLAEVRTSHGLAFAHTGHAFEERISGSLFAARRSLVRALPELRALRDWGFANPREAIFPVLETVNRFTHSDSDRIGVEHISPVLRAELDEPLEEGGSRSSGSFAAFADRLIGIAERAWALLSDPDEVHPVSHDVYLKLFQLERPDLPYDVILFDEAQDANPAMLAVVLSQCAQHIFVGDPHQQVYAWRGAVDAMDRVQGCELALSKSFRFRDEIAGQATELLHLFKGETREIRGVSTPRAAGNRAVLTRTNAGAMQEVLALLEQGRAVALVNRLVELTEALLAAYRLFRGEPPGHPELSLFRSWDELKRVVERFPSMASQYRPYVILVETYRERIPAICSTLEERLSPETAADVVVSTVHRAKGREWDEVRLGRDFENVTLAELIPGSGHRPPCVRFYPEEVNVAYVAFTRARFRLDLGAFEGPYARQRALAREVLEGRRRAC